ncbi:fumarylacetoacetate hydrolase family protein [Glaciimonas sp. PCH181]|uniref:fumarylacetoacetate hydrolase family protein n=1 Tax=Glaciimonas sp. PCH181 TaxID=2133943 RepID=UPI000D39E53A|nr:fumarylacetoacetate hydrolase family protein [Glaciimonas sp. PCH181]PUA17668.1 2-hydroxyhepta-2,4-diene-1,7-dioate isomerase [Glaciimonas sp. PCH181]
MKLCRYGRIGKEQPGLIGPDGELRDLSGLIADLTPDQLAGDKLAVLAKLDPRSLPLVEGRPRLGAPVRDIPKFIAIGLNYLDHAEEAGLAIPTEPIIFLKATSCISGPNDDIVEPLDSTKLDWEVELGIIIGTQARNVLEAEALDYVAGYCVVNDVSERAFQFQSSQWDKGKGCDSFGPVGPWLVTKDEVIDPQNLDLWLDVNGKRMQTGNTSKMIFSVRQIISYCSRYMTLQPGDVIITGTPPGVGMGIKPVPVWLKPSDIVQLGITGLGSQRQRIVATEVSVHD